MSPNSKPEVVEADVDDLDAEQARAVADTQGRIVDLLAGDSSFDDALPVIIEELESLWPNSRVAVVWPDAEADSAIAGAGSVSDDVVGILSELTVDDARIARYARLADDSHAAILRPTRDTWGEISSTIEAAGFGAILIVEVFPGRDDLRAWLVVLSPEKITAVDEVAVLIHHAGLIRLALSQHLSELTMHRLISDERRALAGVLHDDPIQVMTGVSLRLQRLRPRVDEAGVAILTDVQQAVTASIERLRRLLVDLHPPSLDDDGLAAAIENYLYEVVEPHGIHVDFAATEDVEPDSGTAALAYRLSVEALWNVVKHSGASTVRVDVAAHGGGVDIAVRDDGRGFDPAVAQRRKIGHMGMANCIELAARASGRFEVESEQGSGTAVRIHLPGLRPVQDTT